MFTIISRFAATVLALAQAQAPAAFDVVSIKISDGQTDRMSYRVTPNSIIGSNVTLVDCIADAYDVQYCQIVNRPQWGMSRRFQVLAKVTEAGPISRSTARVLFRSVLADQFKLTVHEEPREMTVYAL